MHLIASGLFPQLYPGKFQLPSEWEQCWKIICEHYILQDLSQRLVANAARISVDPEAEQPSVRSIQCHLYTQKHVS